MQEQPGAEHEMNPKPSHKKEDYKAAGKLTGKVAVITGGDSGIGRSVAHLFALEGAQVAITYVSDKEKKDAEEVVELVKSAGAPGKHPLALQADLGTEQACKEIIDKVVHHFGGIDILVNNASEQHVHQSIEEITAEEWDRTFRTNVYSYFFMTKLALPYMKEGSTIINTTSINAYKGNPSLIPYTATKGAELAFTRSIALALASRNIRANAVAPGPIWTPLITSTMSEEKHSNFGSQTPLGRPGQPDEVATCYVFLASSDSSYITGQTLHPNGGAVVNG
jgi:NAD(P)-dependent dehydrogenase (short-subunit alcohol dehydrogenase family)